LLRRIAAISLSPSPSTAALVREFEALPHWAAIAKTLGCTRHAADKAAAAASDGETSYTCTGLSDFGNNYLTPVVGGGNVLRQLRSLAGCLPLLTQRERDAGRRYSRVIHSRIDYVWLRPHPPLSLLDPRAVWAPWGEDYGGVTDRHAVMRRDVAPVYFGRYEMIRDGRVMQIDPGLREQKPRGMSSERLLGHVLKAHGLPTGRFPPFAYLGCCRTGAAGCRLRVCFAGKMPQAGGPVARVHGKYIREIRGAVKHTMAAELGGAVLEPAPLGQLASRPHLPDSNASLWLRADEASRAGFERNLSQLNKHYLTEPTPLVSFSSAATARVAGSR